MKLKYKYQKFQADAAKAVVDVFAGQPYLTPSYLRGIEKHVFDQFRNNPEEFILKAAALINDEKATAIIQHITYHILDEKYETDIFADD